MKVNSRLRDHWPVLHEGCLNKRVWIHYALLSYTEHFAREYSASKFGLTSFSQVAR